MKGERGWRWEGGCVEKEIRGKMKERGERRSRGRRKKNREREERRLKGCGRVVEG